MSELALTTLSFLYIKDGEVLSSKFQKIWKQWEQFTMREASDIFVNTDIQWSRRNWANIHLPF